MKNILVAVDKRNEAGQLTNYAVNLAKLTNAKIWIIHVTEPNPDDFLAREAGPQYVYDKRDAEHEEQAATIKKWAENISQNHQVPAEGVLITGSITESIKKIVDEKNIDLVVAGHKKRGFLYDLFSSNKKKDLVDELKVPLLSVPIV